jgi:hypothetical protein
MNYELGIGATVSPVLTLQVTLLILKSVYTWQVPMFWDTKLKWRFEIKKDF